MVFVELVNYCVSLGRAGELQACAFGLYGFADLLAGLVDCVLEGCWLWRHFRGSWGRRVMEG